MSLRAQHESRAVEVPARTTVRNSDFTLAVAVVRLHTVLRLVSAEFPVGFILRGDTVVHASMLTSAFTHCLF